MTRYNLQNRASKGKTGGRTIPLHPALHDTLVALQTARGEMATPERSVLFSERGGGLSPATVRLRFHRLYTSLPMDGVLIRSRPGTPSGADHAFDGAQW